MQLHSYMISNRQKILRSDWFLSLLKKTKQICQTITVIESTPIVDEIPVPFAGHPQNQIYLTRLKCLIPVGVEEFDHV